MPQAHLCSCNHGKTNHRHTNQTPKNPPLYHECLVDNCQCQQYEENKRIAPQFVNYQQEFKNLSELI